jgi:glycolate oxidase iron-sulfur subunit
MACVTSCPSGVRYDALIESTRAKVEREYRRPRGERWRRSALFSVLPYHRRLRPAAYALALRLPAPKIAPRLKLSAIRQQPPSRTAAAGEPRMKVAMLLGCVQRAFFGDVNAATARVLAAYGCEVLAPRDQGCCGALELHAGRGPAERRRTALLDRLGALGVDRIVVNSAGCGSALKEADHPAAALVRDVHEVLAELGPPRRLGRLDLRVAYHDACHLGHAQGVRAEPRAVLAAIPGIQLLEVPDAEICCGSAGVYNLLQPGPASDLGRRKAAAIDALGADVIAAANPGCLIQISAYLERRIPTLHPVQLVDRALRA